MFIAIIAALIFGLAVGLVWTPAFLVRPSAFAAAWVPGVRRAFGLSAASVAVWTAFVFWQGTHYATFTCHDAGRLSDAFERTDLSVRELNRVISDISRQFEQPHLARIRTQADTL